MGVKQKPKAGHGGSKADDNKNGKHKSKQQQQLPDVAEPTPAVNKPNNVFGAYENPYRFNVVQYGKPKTLTILQDFSQNIWPGGAIWECGVLLGKLLQDPDLFPPEDWGTMSCVEMGCGPGLTGLAAAALGAKVVLTDKPQVVEQIAQPNVLNNADVHKGRAAACPLWWGEDTSPVLAALEGLEGASAAGGSKATKKGSKKPGGSSKNNPASSGTPSAKPKVDLIIGTDLAYESVFFSKLLNSLLELSEEGTRWILGQRHRREFSEDLIHMIEKHFVLEKTVPAHEIDRKYVGVSKPIFVFFFRRKSMKTDDQEPVAVDDAAEENHDARSEHRA